MKRKKRTRTGNSGWIFAAAIALVALVAVGEGRMFGAKKEKKTLISDAVVAGTVFRETGMSFPGVEVTIALAPDVQPSRPFKKIRVTTSLRGEFAVHVPPGPAKYVVSVKAPGYEPQEKPAAVSAEERVDVFFRLDPASKR